jgi:hypothetical protein
MNTVFTQLQKRKYKDRVWWKLGRAGSVFGYMYSTYCLPELQTLTFTYFYYIVTKEHILKIGCNLQKS